MIGLHAMAAWPEILSRQDIFRLQSCEKGIATAGEVVVDFSYDIVVVWRVGRVMRQYGYAINV